MIAFLRRLFARHQYKYHNPYDRTCLVCGRHEVEHCPPGRWAYGWWEVWDKGDETKICNGGTLQ